MDAAHDVVLRRDFAAPPAAVFRAWTEPVRFARWFGPQGFRVDVTAGVRVGGRYALVLHGEDGATYPLKGEYREIVADRCLVLSCNWEDHPADWKQGMAALGAAPGMAEEMLWLVDFAAAAAGCRQTLTCRFADAAMREAHVAAGIEQGWRSSFGKLDRLLAE
ncbi:SRPBCC family protein [Tahibacter caeni]|uniref:SRPBCC family protein n=1 Tax=Tahibacter caeni TaxID=1453545 RepID=UPI00214797D2